ncbi:MAG: LysM domain-containing protein [Gaiellaceae bacterium]
MFVKIALATILLAAAVGWSARPSESAQPARHYVVQPGDTLWAIAVEHFGGDPREAVWRLEQGNQTAVGDGLQPGETLLLPAG